MSGFGAFAEYARAPESALTRKSASLCYDVDQLRKRGRKPIGDGPAQVVPVRIYASLLAGADRTC